MNVESVFYHLFNIKHNVQQEQAMMIEWYRYTIQSG